MGDPGPRGNGTVAVTYRVVAVAVVGLVVALGGVLVQQVQAAQATQAAQLAAVTAVQSVRGERIASLESDRRALALQLEEMNRRLTVIETKVDRLAAGGPR